MVTDGLSVWILHHFHLYVSGSVSYPDPYFLMQHLKNTQMFEEFMFRLYSYSNCGFQVCLWLMATISFSFATVPLRLCCCFVFLDIFALFCKHFYLNEDEAEMFGGQSVTLALLPHTENHNFTHIMTISHPINQNDPQPRWWDAYLIPCFLCGMV